MEHCYIYYKHKVPGVLHNKNITNIVVPQLMVGKEYRCKQCNHKWMELFDSILFIYTKLEIKYYYADQNSVLDVPIFKYRKH